MMEPILIITTFPDNKSATALARKLIDEQLAACVNILGPCTSVYHWQGKTESSAEIPILIKTRQPHYAQVEQIIKAMHPYELPEVISVPVDGGLSAYLQWIASATPILTDDKPN